MVSIEMKIVVIHSSQTEQHKQVSRQYACIIGQPSPKHMIVTYGCVSCYRCSDTICTHAFARLIFVGHSRSRVTDLKILFPGHAIINMWFTAPIHGLSLGGWCRLVTEVLRRSLSIFHLDNKRAKGFRGRINQLHQKRTVASACDDL